MELLWNPETADPAVREVLRTLGEEYPLRESAHDADLVLEKIDDPAELRVSRRDRRWVVGYGRASLAARGVAYALAGRECREKTTFRTFGILFDCTRGNVMTVTHFKHWLRRLALMGYNMAMLYTKDAYQLPGEPYFGYMRGAYSLKEIRELDAYAKKLQIEMIGAIQVLGHLEPILRWSAYGEVRDTSSAIMVDKPESYELIEKMIGFWSEALTSRRIHLGMDECHDLGRGRYMDRHGYESQFSLYNRHLEKVNRICRKMDLEPIIWSDMYFRYANPRQDYYDTDTVVPDEVKKAIPKNIRFSYWDYYHREPGIYKTMLTRTAELNGSKPIMASGIWTWRHFWTDYETTFATVRPCIQACRETGTDELIFTLWGDDGGYCDFDSAFAGLAWAADCAANPEENEERAAELFEAVCGTSYRLQIACGKLCYTWTDSENRIMKVLAPPQLWDDPLLGIAWHEFPGYPPQIVETLLEEYGKIMAAAAPRREDRRAGHIDYAWNLARVLTLKLELRRKLDRAYEKRDAATLREIAERDIPEVIGAIASLLDAFRTQWLRSFKPFGLELMQIRLGGLTERYRELARTIGEFLRGDSASLPEPEADFRPRGAIPITYHEIATGGFFL